MRAGVIKGLFGSLLALGVLSYGLSFLPLDFLQPSIERAIERGLGRRVEIGEVHLSFLNGPGVALDRMTIEEDSRAGAEPFAYAERVEARLDLLALLRGHLNFSSLRFNDASLNLVKPDNAPWNFQMLLATAPSPGGSADLPAIKMRAGRVNLKFGQTKSVVYFDDADLDVSANSSRIVDVRFSGVPTRNDRPTRNLEHFFVRGTYNPADPEPLHLQAELEPSPLDAVAHLFTPQIFPLKGSLAVAAEISGAPTDLRVKGDIHLDTGPKWIYQGHLNLPAQQLQLESVVDPGSATSGGDKGATPAPLSLHVWDILSVPHWEATLKQAPLETFLSLARVSGAPIPDSFTVEGVADGSIAYRDESGLAGEIDMSGVAMQFGVENNASRAPHPPAAHMPVSIARAAILVNNGCAAFGPVTIDAGTAGMLEATGDYSFATPGAGTVRVSSRAFDIGQADPRMLAFVPLLDRATHGVWKGMLRYARLPGAPADWSGNYEIANARLAVDGLADPLRIQSATVAMKSGQIDVTRLSARAGQIPFTGEYHFAAALPGNDAGLVPDSVKDAPQTFRLAAGAISLTELEHLFTPALARGGGFFARTLGLGSSENAPGWLAQRSVDGFLSVQSLTLGDRDAKLAPKPAIKLDAAHVIWKGTTATVTATRGTLDDAALTGTLTADLSGPVPAYHVAGKIDGALYKSGRIDIDGTADGAGVGVALLGSLRAHGSFRGQGIAFSPEAEFRRVAGHFEFRLTGAQPTLTVQDLELLQGSDTLSGEGATNPDGKLVLDLTSGGRQVHYTGSLIGEIIEPRGSSGGNPASAAVIGVSRAQPAKVRE